MTWYSVGYVCFFFFVCFMLFVLFSTQSCIVLRDCSLRETTSSNFTFLGGVGGKGGGGDTNTNCHLKCELALRYL